MGRMSAGALEDCLEGVELGDLVADLPGDHRRQEFHEAGGPQLEREPYRCGARGRLGEFEHARWPCRSGGDLELQPGWRVEHGDPVVAVDPAAGRAWARTRTRGSG